MSEKQEENISAEVKDESIISHCENFLENILFIIIHELWVMDV